MPFFPLAGGEAVALILLFVITRWILRTGWRAALEDDAAPQRRTLEPPEPEGGQAPPAPRRPALRLIRGGLDGQPPTPAVARRASHRER